MEDNPFCMLFPSVEDVHNASVIALRQKLAVSDVLTRIFLFTAATGMTPYIVESYVRLYINMYVCTTFIISTLKMMLIRAFEMENGLRLMLFVYLNSVLTIGSVECYNRTTLPRFTRTLTDSHQRLQYP